VVENEYKLLLNGGLQVRQAIYDNTEISVNKMFFNKQSYQQTFETINEFEPDVLHVHNIFYDASPSVFYAARKAKIPSVITLHNFRLMCPGALFLRNGEVCTKCKDLTFPYYGVVHKCFKHSRSKSFALATFLGVHNAIGTWKDKVDYFIVLTPFIKKLVVSSGLKIDPDRVIVKPNSTDDFQENTIGVSKKNGYLFVGRLSKEKGVNTLIHAFNKMPDKLLEIVGTGDLENELRAIAQKNIIFHGVKDKDFIKQKLNESKALMFPSICFEGLPNTIIEAFSAGIPVLASDIDNVNTIVTNNYNGKTFKTGSVYELVKVVKTFDAKTNAELCLNARKTFEEKYTHEKNLEALKGIYEKMIL